MGNAASVPPSGSWASWASSAPRMSPPTASREGSSTFPCRNAPSPSMLDSSSPTASRPNPLSGPPPPGEKWHWLQRLTPVLNCHCG